MKKESKKKRSIAGRILVWAVGIAGQVALLGLTVLLVWAFQSRSMPDLKLWHTSVLTREFTADDASRHTTLTDYLDLESRLFDEVKNKVYDRVGSSENLAYSRYRADGPQDPRSRQPDWNRTYERMPDRIRGGALLLHGLTDSPYSLRAIGELLHDRGFYVLGLRLPGHGTIPGALTTVHWKDWVAASRIGARHVRDRIGPDRPFVIAGYSNGGALSVKYALDALNEPDLPLPDRLFLFSPEIGISKLSVIANSHKLFSFLPYFGQFKWVDIQPEYDPYKYNSFPKNAAQQAHDLTSLLQDQIEESRNSKLFSAFPPVLTFLSWVDATVQTPATIHRFYNRLENKGSELVIFDVNRLDQLASFIPAANEGPLKDLEASPDLPYRLTVVTNAGRQTRGLVQRTKAPRSATVEAIDLPYQWPLWIFSLGHVAIPFSPEDPVYGASTGLEGPYSGLPLGALAPRGETHLLTVPLSKLMRLRYNPFFAYVEKRIAKETEQFVENMP